MTLGAVFLTSFLFEMFSAVKMKYSGRWIGYQAISIGETQGENQT